MPHPIALGEGAAPVIGRDLASGALRPAASPARATVRVDRCICRDRLFADLLPEARVQGWDLAALMAATGCGAQCGLCRPYLRRMLETGETVFHELLPAEPA
jgi:bacterioferritin-associated ferredoxin